MALAGLWENWRSPPGEWARSFAVITTTPNKLCAELRDRMPVVLSPKRWPEWLGEGPADARQLKAILAPYRSEEMTCWPVSTRMGNVKKQWPEPDRAGLSAMNLYRCLAVVVVILALGGCAQMATRQGQAPDAPYPPDGNAEYPRDSGGDGGGGGGGGGM
jgi:hypothetical protein